MIDHNKTTIQTLPRSCYWLAVYLLGMVFIGLASILSIHLNAIYLISGSSLLRSHALCASFGLLGASMAAIRKYYKFLITDAVTRSDPGKTSILTQSWGLGWLIYYVSRPIMGLAMGALSFTLSFVGFQVLSQPGSSGLSDQGRYLLFGIAYLAGFSVSHVLDRLNSISRQVFSAKPKEEE